MDNGLPKRANIHVLTLFPGMFTGFLTSSIPAIAIEKEKLSVSLTDIRDFADNKHRQVDDYQYGGGAGMVLKPEPIAATIESLPIWQDNIDNPNIPIIYFTPQGRLLNQKMVRDFLSYPDLIILCGHYKEVDQRIRDKYITHEVSVGDYILSGGELPAMILIDAIARLLDGVINDLDSALTDSHENGLLGYPCYTRPYDFQGMLVPEVLCSGHHENIQKWRVQKSLEITQRVRPDLIENRDTRGE
jgi:tRNA (guanine37-N1)-methyltransferase